MTDYDQNEPQIVFPRELSVVVDGLQQARRDWRAGHARHAERGIRFPSRQALGRILRELGTALFPLRLGPPELTAGNENRWVEATLESTLSQLAAQIALELRNVQPWVNSVQEGERADQIVGAFAASLPSPPFKRHLMRNCGNDRLWAPKRDEAARSCHERQLPLDGNDRCYFSLRNDLDLPCSRGPRQFSV